MLPEAVLSEVGRLDPAAIAEVREESWPDVRDADELHDVLQTLIAVPELSLPDTPSAGMSLAPASSFEGFRPQLRAIAWREYFATLAAERRAARAVVAERSYWVAAEKKKIFTAVFPDARFESDLPDMEGASFREEDVLLAFVTGWMAHRRSRDCANAWATLLGIAMPDIDQGASAPGGKWRDICADTSPAPRRGGN